jgi:soluble cytochrome b562
MQPSTGWRRFLVLGTTFVVAQVSGARAYAQESDVDAARTHELVSRVRSSMREIDSLLLKSALPEKAEKRLAANQKRLEDLLKETEAKSRGVVQDIDELIKLQKFKGG